MNYHNFNKEELIQVLKQKDMIIDALNKEMNKFKHYASIDDMTNIFNRRAGMDILEEKMNTAKTYEKPLTICFVDVDEFKKVNDTFGHEIGDRLLINVSRMIKENIRKSDIVFRIAGDEFLIIFPNTTYKQALKIWNRVSMKIDEINNGGNYPYDISLSHGFSEYYVGCEITVKDLIEISDKEMYRNKNKKLWRNLK